MDFRIPLRFTDLADQSYAEEQLVASQVADTPEAVVHALDTLENDTASDCTALADQDNFDCLYGALTHFPTLDDDSQHRAFAVCCIALEDLSTSVLGSATSQTDKTAIRNALLISCYFGVQMIIVKDNCAVVSPVSDAKRRKQAHATTWVAEKNKFLVLLHEVLRLDRLLELWEPPAVDESLVNLIGNLCFKLLERPETVKEPALVQPVGDVLFELFTKFNYSLSGSVRLVQLLQQFAHACDTLAVYVAEFSKKGCRHVLHDVFRELGGIDADDLKTEGGSAKSCADFVVALSDQIPDSVIPVIDVISPLLGCESSTLRNAILGCFGQLLLQKLGGDDLSERDRNRRDSFLDALSAHLHDAHALVRANTCRLWCRLLEDNRIPRVALTAMLPRMTGRLLDKSSTVRKHAIQFMTDLVMHRIGKDPFLRQLTIASQKEELTKAEAKLERLISAAEPEDVSSQERAVSTAVMSPEIEQERRGIEYLKECGVLLTEFQRSVRETCQLLKSKTNTDVLQTIDFLVTCAEAKIEGSGDVHVHIFNLVWSRDERIQSAVLGAFNRLFVLETRGQPEQTARHVMQLLDESPLRLRTSVERIIASLVKSGQFNHAFFTALREITRTGSVDDAVLALNVLAVCVTEDPSLLKSSIDGLIADAVAKNNAKFTNVVAKAFEQLSLIPKGAGGLSRLPSNSPVFVNIVEIICRGLTDDPTKEWLEAVQHLLVGIFGLCRAPHNLCFDLLSRVAPSCVESIALWPRLFALVGTIAVRLLAWMEVPVVDELKRQSTEKESQKDAGKKGKGSRKSMAASLMSLSAASSSMAANDEENMGLVGAQADDMEYDYATRVMDADVLAPTHILGCIARLAVSVCNKPERYRNLELQSAATFALGRMMLISGPFCQQHMQLLVTICERSRFVEVRANTIMVLGDLFQRWPNSVEPWTPNLYSRMDDTSLAVRMNCLLVLTHLILNDMIKVKGYTAELVRRTKDPDERLAGLTRNFLFQLKDKGNNPLYNNMPDMISRLMPLPGAVFDELIDFLFSLIQKDRQIESLLERICQRFPMTRKPEDWRKLAYCVAKLPLGNERALKKLQELTPCFAEALAADEVFALMSAVLDDVKKPEMRELAESMYETWHEIHASGADDLAAVNRARAAVEGGKKGTSSETPKTVQHGAARSRRGAPHLTPVPACLTEEEEGEGDAAGENRGRDGDVPGPSGTPTETRRRTTAREPRMVPAVRQQGGGGGIERTVSSVSKTSSVGKRRLHDPSQKTPVDPPGTAATRKVRAREAVRVLSEEEVDVNSPTGPQWDDPAPSGAEADKENAVGDSPGSSPFVSKNTARRIPPLSASNAAGSTRKKRRAPSPAASSTPSSPSPDDHGSSPEPTGARRTRRRPRGRQSTDVENEDDRVAEDARAPSKNKGGRANEVKQSSRARNGGRRGGAVPESQPPKETPRVLSRKRAKKDAAPVELPNGTPVAAGRRTRSSASTADISSAAAPTSGLRRSSRKK